MAVFSKKKIDRKNNNNKNSINNKNNKIISKDNPIKIFPKLCAFNWWKKLALTNILWSIGFIFVFLAFFWQGDDASRISANKTLSFILLGFGLFATYFIILFYWYKRIKSFSNLRKYIVFICACIMPLACIVIWPLTWLESKAFYNCNEVIKLGLKKHKKGSPHVYLILLSIIFVIILASWIVSWTQSPTKEIINGDVVYKTEASPIGLFYLFIAPIEGFVKQAELVIFLLIMGGFLAIVTESKALEAGLGRMVKKLKGKEIIMVPLLFLLFSAGGTTYGMAEETIPFYLLLIPVFLAAGFDVWTPFIIILFGAGMGTASSILNPFVVSAAVNAASNSQNWPGEALAPSIGIVWRSVIYVVLVILCGTYLTWYAWRVKKHPHKSTVYDLKQHHENKFKFDLNSLPQYTLKRKIILGCFLLTFILMIVSVIAWKDLMNTDIFIKMNEWVAINLPFLGGQKNEWVEGSSNALFHAWGEWYLLEMSFLFLVIAIIIGLLSWQGHKHFISKFMSGVGDFIGVSFVISIAKGISVASEASGLSNFIVDGLSNMISGIGNVYLVVIIFYLIFIILSMMIPSTSGFASVVFPLLGPTLAAPVNVAAGLTVSGQIASFSLASGFINVCSPTSGIFVTALSVSEIPLSKFYKKVWPLILVVALVSISLLLIGQSLNSGGFDNLNQANNAIF